MLQKYAKRIVCESKKTIMNNDLGKAKIFHAIWISISRKPSPEKMPKLEKEKFNGVTYQCTPKAVQMEEVRI